MTEILFGYIAEKNLRERLRCLESGVDDFSVKKNGFFLHKESQMYVVFSKDLQVGYVEEGADCFKMIKEFNDEVCLSVV